MYQSELCQNCLESSKIFIPEFSDFSIYKESCTDLIQFVSDSIFMFRYLGAISSFMLES